MAFKFFWKKYNFNLKFLKIWTISKLKSSSSVMPHNIFHKVSTTFHLFQVRCLLENNFIRASDIVSLILFCPFRINVVLFCEIFIFAWRWATLLFRIASFLGFRLMRMVRLIAPALVLAFFFTFTFRLLLTVFKRIFYWMDRFSLQDHTVAVYEIQIGGIRPQIAEKIK